MITAHLPAGSSLHTIPVNLSSEGAAPDFPICFRRPFWHLRNRRPLPPGPSPPPLFFQPEEGRISCFRQNPGSFGGRGGNFLPEPPLPVLGKEGEFNPPVCFLGDSALESAMISASPRASCFQPNSGPRGKGGDSSCSTRPGSWRGAADSTRWPGWFQFSAGGIRNRL